MSPIAELDVAPDAFVFPRSVEAVREIRIDIVRNIGEEAIAAPFAWVYGAVIDDFEAALAGDPTVEQVEQFGDGEDGDGNERLFRINCTAPRPPLVEAIDGVDGTLLEASYHQEQWNLTVILPDGSALADLHEDARELGIALELRRVYEPHERHHRGAYGITEEQFEALVAAYRAGYFEVPRRHTLSGIADELDISANALSARLRRGLRRLLASTIAKDP